MKKMKKKSMLSLFIGILFLFLLIYPLRLWLEQGMIRELKRNSDRWAGYLVEEMDKRRQGVYEDIQMFSKIIVKDYEIDQISQYTSIPYEWESQFLEYTQTDKNLFLLFEIYAEHNEGTQAVYLGNEWGGYLVWPDTPVPAKYDPRLRPWYIAASSESEVVQSPPYVDLVTGKTIVSFVKSLYDGSEKIGVFGIDYNVDSFFNDMLFDFAENGLMIMHSDGDILEATSEYFMIFNWADVDKIENTVFKWTGEDDQNYWGSLKILPNDMLIVYLEAHKKLLRTTFFDMLKSLITFVGIVFFIIMISKMLYYAMLYQKKMLKNMSEYQKHNKILEGNIPGAVFRIKRHYPWDILYMSEGVEGILGYRPIDFLGRNAKNLWLECIDSEDKSIFEEYREKLQLNQPSELKYRMKKADGSKVWILEKSIVVEDSEGERHINGIAFDVTKEVEQEIVLKEKNQSLEEANIEIQALYEQMAAAEETLRYNYDELDDYKKQLEEERLRYELILKASNESFWDIHLETEIFELANSFSLDESKGSNVTDLDHFLEMIHPEDRHKLVWFYEEDKNKIPDVHQVTIQINRDGENFRWYKMMGITSKDRYGNVNRIVGSLMDIHDLNIQKERVEFYAYHDSATGLYNLDYFLECIQKEKQNPSIEEKTLHFMIVMGIADYDKLSGLHGHNKMDVLLFQLSASIKDTFDGTDDICVLNRGRFALWIRESHSMSKLENQMYQLKRCFETFIYSELLYSGIACGAVSFNIDENDGADALKKAEIAYEHSEKSDRSFDVIWFTKEMEDASNRLSNLEYHLRNAVKNNEFRLVFQPQYDDYHQKNLHAFEALIRWTNEDLGFVRPDEFIPLAERIGFIDEIGNYVMNATCQFISKFQEQYGKKISVAINASLKEIAKEEYFFSLVLCVEKYKLKPENIHIEITETAIAEYLDAVKENLNRIKAFGFEIHMDDFGTGYSSLSQLSTMPIHVLKIDRSFVDSILESDQTQQLVSLIIKTGVAYNLKIIAEGVENEEQYNMLKEMGCHYYQGYGLSRPMELDDILSQEW